MSENSLDNPINNTQSNDNHPNFLCQNINCEECIKKRSINFNRLNIPYYNYNSNIPYYNYNSNIP